MRYYSGVILRKERRKGGWRRRGRREREGRKEDILGREGREERGREERREGEKKEGGGRKGMVHSSMKIVIICQHILSTKVRDDQIILII